MSFLTNTTIIGTTTSYSPFYIFDIFSGDKIDSYDTSGLIFLTDLAVSFDRKLFAVAGAGQYLIVFNISSHESWSMDILIPSKTSIIIKFTTNNKYILAFSSDDSLFFIVNTTSRKIIFENYFDTTYPNYFDFEPES